MAQRTMDRVGDWDRVGDCDRVAFVQASWHGAIVERCRMGFCDEAASLGLGGDRIDRFCVPGSFEIPLHALCLARSGRYAAVIGAGFVVDGGIYRHEFVAEAVIGGLMRVQLDTGVPVISVVLTPHHFQEHEAHASFFGDHLEEKGREAARACLRTIESLGALPQPALAY